MRVSTDQNITSLCEEISNKNNSKLFDIMYKFEYLDTETNTKKDEGRSSGVSHCKIVPGTDGTVADITPCVVTFGEYQDLVF